MVRLFLLALFCAQAAGEDFDKALRSLRSDDRDRRRAALDAFAKGEIEPSSARQRDRAFEGLRRFLSDQFPGDDRAQAVRAMGLLGTDRAYGAVLDRLASDSDDRVLEAAEQAFRAAPEALGDDLGLRIERAEDPVVRAGYVRMLGALPGAEARIRLRAAMADHWCPRAAAALALARDKSPDALPPLVALLDSDDPALLTAAIESLMAITRQDLGRDPALWKAWWETKDEVGKIDESLAGKEGGAGGGDPQPDGERRTIARPSTRKTIGGTYFGIPVTGTKVAFVCDVSGSMRYKLDISYDQLTRAVKALPRASQFEVIFFNEHVWPWRGRLSRADPVTKELLLRHLPTIEVKNYTNLFDSIEAALELGVDEVFVISDGEPNRGRKQFPDEILAELKRINTRHTRIHTVSVIRTVDGDEHVGILKRIAEENGGEHVERTLR
ncbi:MAG TPA: HEAT repeat domain-containing protein [Planctomycetota bacterium]|nr:HEAT repeat domain-containing protein [Planctomycetota bacterium]